MSALRWLLLAGTVAVTPSAVQGQAPGTAAGGLVATVRDATARFRDRDEAVRAGYRPIGPDFPGMGEHWISVPLLLEGGIDPRRPPILEYAVLDGEVTLVGAAFAALVPANGAPPTAGLPVSAADWHFHGGTVSEESFVLGHAHGESGSGDKPRVAVLHIWAWLDNPDGPFATDNWALPFHRLGLPSPARAPDTDAAHALALAAGGERYYLGVIDAATTLPASRRTEVAALLVAAGTEIRRELSPASLDAALPVIAERWRTVRSEVASLTGVALPGGAKEHGPHH